MCSHPPALPEIYPDWKEIADKKIFQAGVPNKGEQMVRYYGFYNNVSRGKRKSTNQDDLIPSILEPEGSSSEYWKNWARRRVLPEIMRLTYAVMQRNMVPFIYALEAT